MRFLRSLRWLLLAAVLVALAPAFAHAAVFISVGYAPPPLVVYEQPPCPEPGWMWVPGYWYYGPDGYYWVPGTWVPAPYEGALWTPGYWGWNAGLYVWHPGYWARHVGYYGGINYGFGYFGIGFVGGRWHDRRFEYNAAVMRVDRDRIRDIYDDRHAIREHMVENDRHIGYNGGPGGIRYAPTREDRMVEREQHMGRTPLQMQHVDNAMRDRALYFKDNHGRPPVMAQERPRGYQGRGNANGRNPVYQNNPREMQQRRPEPQPRQQYDQRQQEQRREQPQYQQGRQPQYQQRGEPSRQQPQYQQRPEQGRPQPQHVMRPPQQRPQEMRPQPQYQQRQQEPRRQPEARPQREQRQDRPQGHDEHGRGH